MRLDVEEMEGGITRVILVGQLDMVGAGEIDHKFAAIAGKVTRMVVDLSQVSFIASIGIRTLVINAKAMKGRGYRMVLAEAQPCVARVLESAGVNQLIPMAPDLATAAARLADESVP
ncbi:MAG: STAS domain-containing protein [Alphaproteobacteria bacterium]